MTNSSTKKKKGGSGETAHSRHSDSVAAFIAGSSHPQKDGLLLVRELILSADPAIEEGIKWNAPSFWRGEWFAKFHLHAKSGLVVVLHRGAKAKPGNTEPFVEDPEGLVTWITNDRGTIAFADSCDVRGKSSALKQIIEAWSGQLA